MILYFVLFHRCQPRWLTQILAIKPENSQMLQLQSTAHNESLILLQWMTWIYTPQDVSLQVLGSLNPNLNLSWKLNPINRLGLTSKRIPIHLGHFQRYLLVGGLVFSVMSLPLFNEFCELRRAPWRWEWRNGQGLGDMTLASSKLEEDLMFFCLFSPGIFEHWTFTYFATTQKTSGKDSTGYFDSRWWALCTYPSFKESRVLGSRI